MSQPSLLGPSRAREAERCAPAEVRFLPAQVAARVVGSVARLCFRTCVHWCHLFPVMLPFPIFYRNGWKMNSNKQQGSHKCHLVATKMETIRCDKGSEDRTWAGEEQRLKSARGMLGNSQLFYLNAEM